VRVGLPTERLIAMNGFPRGRRLRLALGATTLAVASLPIASQHAGAVAYATAQSNPVFTATAMGIVGDPSGNGTWTVAADGQVGRAGSAGGFGHATTERGSTFVMGMASTPTGNGYWIVTHNGGVFSHGDAHFYGSAVNANRRGTVIDIEPSPTGKGYWLFTDRGQVLRFGDAKAFGSPATLTKGPIVDAAVTPSGRGYWLVSSLGGVYNYGDADWFGTAWKHTPATITGIASTETGRGYYLTHTAGGVLNYGDARWYGSLRNRCVGNPVVGIATSRAVRGYWLLVASGRSFAFSPTANGGECGPTGTSKTAVAVRDLFDRLNAERQARGLAALRWDDKLATESASWSSEMADSGFRHSNLQRLLVDGRFNLVGENVAWARGGSVTAATLHVAWMESSGHRANMLSPNFQAVGIGVHCSSDGTMWATQEFGRFASSGSAPLAGTPPQHPITRSDAGSARC
jgi:hypothetical protein